MVEKQELLTQEGYNKLEEELEYLKAGDCDWELLGKPECEKRDGYERVCDDSD